MFISMLDGEVVLVSTSLRFSRTFFEKGRNTHLDAKEKIIP